MTKIRQRIQFYGAVQGVGFRYRACHAADAVGATGWVRNEYDGSVLMEIQGTQEQIDSVILMIERGDKGAVIINKSGADYTLDGAQSVLKDGTYKDKLSDSEFTVSGGKISGTIANDAIVVIY